MMPPIFQINAPTRAQGDLSWHFAKPFWLTYLFLLCPPHPLTLFVILCRCWFLFIIYLRGTFSSIHEKVTPHPFQVTVTK